MPTGRQGGLLWGAALGFVLGGSAAPAFSPEQLKTKVNGLLEPLTVASPAYPSPTVGIAAGVITPKGRWTFGFGRAQLRQPEPPNEKTFFELGSVSKVFTAILLADAVTRKKTQLNDSYAPCNKNETSAVCFRGTPIWLVHLATHASGLPFLPTNWEDGAPNPPGEYTRGKLAKFLKQYKLSREPGAGYEYSNLGIALLAEFLVAKEKTTFEKLLRERLTGPLGLKDTTSQLTAEQKTRLAGAYVGGTGSEPQLERPYEMGDGSIFPGAVGIDSTIADLLSWISANVGLTETPLAPVLKLAQQEQRKLDKHTSVALGWHRKGETVFHFGLTPGYRAFVAFDPKKQTGVAVLANTIVKDGRLDEACWELLRYALEN